MPPTQNLKAPTNSPSRRAHFENKILILLSSLLASFQLIQIPSANRHISHIIIHALPKGLHIGLTGWCLGPTTACIALVKAAVHSLGSSRRCCLLDLCGGTGTATKKNHRWHGRWMSRWRRPQQLRPSVQINRGFGSAGRLGDEPVELELAEQQQSTKAAVVVSEEQV